MSDVHTAIVQLVERGAEDKGNGLNVRVDEGSGQLLTLEHLAPSGDDAPPLPGDFVGVKDGAAKAHAVGYVDQKNPAKALDGEKRIYARASDGTVAAEIWLHGDGLIEITAIAAGGRYKIGKLEIDADGNLTTPGEITAKAGTPALVTLTQHTHGTGIGPTTPPSPGQ